MKRPFVKSGERLNGLRSEYAMPVSSTATFTPAPPGRPTAIRCAHASGALTPVPGRKFHCSCCQPATAFAVPGSGGMKPEMCATMFGAALTTRGSAFSDLIADETLLTLTTRVRVVSSPALDACAPAYWTTTSPGRYCASAGPVTPPSSAAAAAGNASASRVASRGKRSGMDAGSVGRGVGGGARPGLQHDRRLRVTGQDLCVPKL